ncbi:hypothetical protein SDJN02_19275, partial [Cucurbita argyrosperma subsp. argyrosperma]|uniref:Transcription initiation factor TFIID subunit 7-like n=2 Tax=Cucurbita TaxID=3660 RepID=A0A6J1F2H4_CUCMO
MEPNSLGGGGGASGGMFPGISSSMLGLELPLHQNPSNPHQLHHPPMVSYVPHEAHHQQQPPPAAVKCPYPAKPKPQQSNVSDEEEQGLADDSNSDAKKKISPWQRMKWTDMMVRLLITAVFYIGDEGGSEPMDHASKKKPVGLLQKKGKWKSVSRAMMEKGFYVSPQQCEDKFNDLNKRYKRVNDILGKGTACRVVENHTLLESMELTPKVKEEVRKLLNSKHLFFREMCAYHNTCRHGAGNSSGGGANTSPEAGTEPSHLPQQQQQQRCFHATETAPAATAGEGSKSGDEEEEDEDEDDETEEDDEEVEEEEIDGSSKVQEEEEETESKKRGRKEGFTSGIQQMCAEVMGVVQDGGRSPWEKKQWMKRRLIQLEEQQVEYQSQGLEIEKQRLKWLKFRRKKERDMERAKLENEKRRLENERMMLMVKQKELDLTDLHNYQQQQQQQQHSSNRRGDPSSITG